MANQTNTMLQLLKVKKCEILFIYLVKFDCFELKIAYIIYIGLIHVIECKRQQTLTELFRHIRTIKSECAYFKIKMQVVQMHDFTLDSSSFPASKKVLAIFLSPQCSRLWLCYSVIVVAEMRVHAFLTCYGRYILYVFPSV